MDVARLSDHKLDVKYDGSLQLAIGRSRRETEWKNQSWSWSRLLKRLTQPTQTAETLAEYDKMSKDDQDKIKDVGGFVGGSLRDGRRRADTVLSRKLITLDADFAPPELTDDLTIQMNCAYAVYSTHKHTPAKPRFRLLIPLDRPVTPDEYEAIARKLADDIGIDYFDDTTYQPARLMYWPSVAQDGDYVFTYEDQPWLQADAVLAKYPDWTDTSFWPESSRTKEQRIKIAKKQGDPREKSGLIGAFCRAYSIEDAIASFLPEVYIPCTIPGRYTYAEGSTAAGLVLYEDGKFAYSNHATDPVSGKLCNAFDLVRIHKFGTLDEDIDAPTTKLPSYKAMIELAREDDQTKQELAQAKRAEAAEDFAEAEWVNHLTYDKRGQMETSLSNVVLIMQYDPGLKGIVYNQMAGNREIISASPWAHPGGFWRDADDAQLEVFLSSHYAEFPKARIMTAVTKVADDRSYHPVREYLDTLPEWDGTERVDTLLIDYLSAEDSAYTRAVTRKTLCAAIARVRHPGCKFDTILVLCGPQGIGKSTLVAKLGGEWFSDAISLADTRDKTAAEKVQGNWIIELGELAGLRKADERDLKSFITRQDDKYRASYGRRVESHPRQSIFIGTTNETEGYLNDTTGGRRFWPVNTPCVGHKKVWDMTQATVDQIWAEAKYRYDVEGEKLILSDDVQSVAAKQQQNAMQNDPRAGMVQEYLDKLLPANWSDLSIYDRRVYLYGNDLGEAPQIGTELRQYVCYQEIWCECFKRPLETMEAKDAYAIRRIMSKIEGWDQTQKRIRIPPYGQQRVYERV